MQLLAMGLQLFARREFFANHLYHSPKRELGLERLSWEKA